MGLVCIQNSSLLVYSKSQKVSASYCLPFRHSRGKNQPVGGFHPPPGLFRVNNQLRLEQKAETKFTELKDAMREYHEVFGHEFSGAPLPEEPVLSDFYTPTNEQHY